MGIRLRYNYIWIFLVLLVAWLTKLNVHPRRATSVVEVVDRMAIGPIEGWVVAVLVFFSYLGPRRQSPPACTSDAARTRWPRDRNGPLEDLRWRRGTRPTTWTRPSLICVGSIRAWVARSTRCGPAGLGRGRCTPFEALLRSIVFQQLAGAAASTIHGRVLALLPSKPPSARALPSLVGRKPAGCGSVAPTSWPRSAISPSAPVGARSRTAAEWRAGPTTASSSG